MNALVVGFFWLVTFVLAVAIPSWTMLVPGGHIFIWEAAAILSGGETVVVLAFVPRNLRGQQDARSVAAAGPDWDPWPIAMTWRGRRPRQGRWGSGLLKALPWWWQ
jgi:hypothetical protein